jgi:hypothetical protein
MSNFEELMKRARRTKLEPRYKFDETISENVVYFEEVADEFHLELADAIEAQAVELTRLREENKASVGLRQRLALAEEIAASLHKQCEAKDAEIERLRKALIGR